MLAATAIGASASVPAHAREAAPRLVLNLPAATLPDALDELARQARVSIGTPGPLPRLRTPALRGTMSVGEALARLLAGSGYAARPVSASAWRIERAAPPRPSPAPSPPPPPETVTETIVVTATKQRLDLSRVPAALSVIGGDSLGGAAAGASTAQAAARIDGLALTGLGAGRNRLFLRGVADSAFNGESQSTVAVVLDEARLTYSAPDPAIRLVDVERVEVLKGPQGSLYGTGALGGIYRMVTRRADLDASTLDLAAGAGAAADGGVGSSASAVANLPLVPGVAAVRAVGYRAIEPGWVDTGAREDANATRVTGARLALGIAPGAGWRLDLTGMAQWLTARDSAYAYRPRRYARPDQLAEPHDNDLAHAAARLSGRIGGVEVLLATGRTWHDIDDTYDATIGAGSFGLANPQRLLDQRAFRVWDSELRLQGRLGAVKWLGGLTALSARQSLSTRLTDANGTAVLVDQDHRVSHDLAAYFDLTVPLTARLSLDAGARAFQSSIRETRQAAPGRVTRETDKRGITPDLALSWRPGADDLVYLRYGSAFRQGGTVISQAGSIETLANDELASLEAGWRRELAGGGRIELGAWFSRWENVQSDTLLADGLIETASAGDARILGAEGSLSLPFAAGWQAEAGGNVTDARLVRNDLGFRLEDRRLPVVPAFTLRAALRRDLMLGATAVWARLDVRYVGPGRMSFDPTLDRRIGEVVETGLQLHAARGRWQADLSLRNLTGNRASTFGLGNPLRYRTMPQYVAQPPRSATLSVSVGF